ncbi:MAG: hypothetical protein J0H94_21215 [Rhizobiales bacterium]|nr:hypothetical protein [Hyphomicrobiales bacterium]
MAIFDDLAPQVMRDLMKDFGLDASRAAAILGNLGHESGGFKFLQEIKPISGRGGYGWAQWTGPRRVQFEAYCTRNKLDPASYKANYGWLFVELTTTEKAAIPALKAAKTLDDQVKAFEKSFERAGVKNYPSRIDWAKRALKAYTANPSLQPVKVDAPIADDPPVGEAITVPTTVPGPEVLNPVDMTSDVGPSPWLVVGVIVAAVAAIVLKLTGVL